MLGKHFAGESIENTQNGFVNLQIKTGNIASQFNGCFHRISQKSLSVVYMISEPGNVVDFV